MYSPLPGGLVVWDCNHKQASNQASCYGLSMASTSLLARTLRCALAGLSWVMMMPPVPPECCCAGGHAGYEIAPFIPSLESLLSLLLLGARPCPALNTVRHHDMHHRFPNKHFSLYFTHWDRWHLDMCALRVLRVLWVLWARRALGLALGQPCSSSACWDGWALISPRLLTGKSAHPRRSVPLTRRGRLRMLCFGRQRCGRGAALLRYTLLLVAQYFEPSQLGRPHAGGWERNTPSTRRMWRHTSKQQQRQLEARQLRQQRRSDADGRPGAMRRP